MVEPFEYACREKTDLIFKVRGLKVLDKDIYYRYRINDLKKQEKKIKDILNSGNSRNGYKDG